MKKFFIRCTLPNAGTLINGTEFKEIDGGVESVQAHPIDVVELFRGISGYEFIDESPEPKRPGRPRKTPS